MLNSLVNLEPLAGHWTDLSSHDSNDVLLDCYIPINEAELNLFTGNDSIFFVSPDHETVIICGTHDQVSVVIPLKEKFANEILKLQS